ncbi:MAG: hypothetical protein WBC44_17605 [Planctomycetaceae bacterium]
MRRRTERRRDFPGFAVIEETGHDEPLVVEPLPAQKIGRLLHERKFCAAARLYSEMTGADLLESKLAIDRLAGRHGLAPINGCASYFSLMIALGGAGVWGVVELVVRAAQL